MDFSAKQILAAHQACFSLNLVLGKFAAFVAAVFVVAAAVFSVLLAVLGG